MKNLIEKLLALWQWLSLFPKILEGSINRYHIEALLEGRNPFLGGSPMSLGEQWGRIRSLYSYMGIKYDDHPSVASYDISHNDDGKRRVLVPANLTVEKLIKLINSSRSDIELILKDDLNSGSFKDARSNQDRSYMLIMDEYRSIGGESEAIGFTENTVLERLLYYTIVYFESGRFIELNRDVICFGTSLKNRKACLKLEKKEGVQKHETTKIIVTLFFTSVGGEDDD